MGTEPNRETFAEFFVGLTGRDVQILGNLHGPEDWEALAGQLTREGNSEGGAYAYGVASAMRLYGALLPSDPEQIG